MEIIIYTYFAINLFLAGYWFNDNLRFESTKYAVSFSFWIILLGVLGCFLFFLLNLFAPILGWLYKEISFQYKFRFTDYWDKIILDDNYSEEYKTREEKLKRSEEIAKQFGKQAIRHNKQIQKKYGK